MNIKSVIRTMVKSINFYDIATTEKEETVDIELYDGEYCSVEHLLSYVDYTTIIIRVGTKRINMCKGIWVFDKSTKTQQSFDNRSDFDSWKESISVSELVNCIIEIKLEDEKGLTTERYYFDSSDMELNSNKRIKLYDFVVLERDSEEVIPELSFKETNCKRGMGKIQDALKKGTFGLSADDCIFILNNIDITDYFCNPIAVDFRYLKKEERGSAHFRFIHRGLKRRIAELKQARSFGEVVLADCTSSVKDKKFAELDREIQELEDRLKAISK